MPQALIKINGVIGSDDDLPLDTLVQLDNENIGGEVTYLWEILDQPAGTPDVLSSATIQNPTFTPKKEGTYLLRLTVNKDLPSEGTDTAIAAVRQLKTRERVPAAGETLEDNPSRGWAEDTNVFLRTLNSFIADPGTVVGVNKTGGTLARGTVVRATSRETIKAGLPGEEDLPGFTTAPATDALNLDELLLIVEQGVDGSNPVSAGGLFVARWLGRIAALPLGAGGVGDRVNVSDSADLSTTPGTNIRQVGSIMAVDGIDRDIWFSGTQGGNKAPDDRAYVVYGNPGPLSNALRVDGLSAGLVINNIPFTVRGGDVTTIPFVVKRFSAGTTANLQEIHDETGTILARFDKDGNLLVPSITITGDLNVGGDLTVGDTNFILRISGTDVEIHGDLGDAKPLAYDRTTNLWRISNELEVLDADFGLFGNTFTPRVNFAPDDRLEYARLSDAYQFVINNFQEMGITASGVTITKGLNIGFVSTPTDDAVFVGDANFGLDLSGADPDIVFANLDLLGFQRATNRWEFSTAGVVVATIADGVTATAQPILRLNPPSTNPARGALVIESSGAGAEPTSLENGELWVHADNAGHNWLAYHPTSGLDQYISPVRKSLIVDSDPVSSTSVVSFVEVGAGPTIRYLVRRLQLRVGSIIKIRTGGFWIQAGAPVILNINVVFAGSTLLAFQQTGVSSSGFWRLNAELIIRALGSGSAAIVQSEGTLNLNETGAPVTLTLSSSPVGFNSETADNNLLVQAGWGSAGNAITMRVFTVEIL